jgi:hypothetical protein
MASESEDCRHVFRGGHERVRNVEGLVVRLKGRHLKARSDSHLTMGMLAYFKLDHACDSPRAPTTSSRSTILKSACHNDDFWLHGIQLTRSRQWSYNVEVCAISSSCNPCNTAPAVSILHHFGPLKFKRNPCPSMRSSHTNQVFLSISLTTSECRSRLAVKRHTKLRAMELWTT